MVQVKIGSPDTKDGEEEQSPAARALAAAGVADKRGYPAVAAGDIVALMAKVMKVRWGVLLLFLFPHRLLFVTCKKCATVCSGGLCTDGRAIAEIYPWSWSALE